MKNNNLKNTDNSIRLTKISNSELINYHRKDPRGFPSLIIQLDKWNVNKNKFIFDKYLCYYKRLKGIKNGEEFWEIGNGQLLDYKYHREEMHYDILPVKNEEDGVYIIDVKHDPKLCPFCLLEDIKMPTETRWELASYCLNAKSGHLISNLFKGYIVCQCHSTKKYYLVSDLDKKLYYAKDGSIKCMMCNSNDISFDSFNLNVYKNKKVILWNADVLCRCGNGGMIYLEEYALDYKQALNNNNGIKILFENHELNKSCSIDLSCRKCGSTMLEFTKYYTYPVLPLPTREEYYESEIGYCMSEILFCKKCGFTFVPAFIELEDKNIKSYDSVFKIRNNEMCSVNNLPGAVRNTEYKII